MRISASALKSKLEMVDGHLKKNEQPLQLRGKEISKHQNKAQRRDHHHPRMDVVQLNDRKIPNSDDTGKNKTKKSVLCKGDTFTRKNTSLSIKNRTSTMTNTRRSTYSRDCAKQETP